VRTDQFIAEGLFSNLLHCSGQSRALIILLFPSMYGTCLDYLFDLHNSINVAYRIIARVTEVVDICNMVYLAQDRHL
jgi:hypothetical protein